MIIIASLSAGLSVAFLVYLLIVRLEKTFEPQILKMVEMVKAVSGGVYRKWLYLFLAFAVTGILAGWYIAPVVFFYPFFKRHAEEYISRRKLRKIESQLVDFLNFYASSVRAGKSLAGGFESALNSTVDPLKGSLEPVLLEVKRGGKLGEAIISWAQETGSGEAYLVGTAISIFQETGGNFTEMIERIVEVLKRRIALRNRIDSLSAMGRLQATVMIFLSPLVVVAMFLMAPELVSKATGNLLSLFLFILAFFLEIFALIIMRRMLKIDY